MWNLKSCGFAECRGQKVRKTGKGPPCGIFGVWVCHEGKKIGIPRAGHFFNSKTPPTPSSSFFYFSRFALHSFQCPHSLRYELTDSLRPIVSNPSVGPILQIPIVRSHHLTPNCQPLKFHSNQSFLHRQINDIKNTWLKHKLARLKWPRPRKPHAPSLQQTHRRR